jgi:hypothetical protein
MNRIESTFPLFDDCSDLISHVIILHFLVATITQQNSLSWSDPTSYNSSDSYCHLRTGVYVCVHSMFAIAYKEHKIL